MSDSRPQTISGEGRDNAQQTFQSTAHAITRQVLAAVTARDISPHSLESNRSNTFHSTTSTALAGRASPPSFWSLDTLQQVLARPFVPAAAYEEEMGPTSLVFQVARFAAGVAVFKVYGFQVALIGILVHHLVFLYFYERQTPCKCVRICKD